METVCTKRRSLAPAAIAVVSVLALVGVARQAGAQPSPPWLNFTGPGSGYVEVPDSPALDPTSAITIEAWVYLQDVHGYGGDCPTFVGKDWHTSYWFGLSCGNARLRFYSHGGIVNDSTGSVPMGTWTHVAATYDGARTTFYINGHLDSTFAGTAAPVGTNTSPLRIGADVSWMISPHGEIDQVRLWNVARSQCDIVATMNEEIRSPFTGLVGSWNLDGGANDALGTHNGTLVSAAGYLSIPMPMCAHMYFVPTAGHLPGLGGTQWATDLSVLNVGYAKNSIQLTLLPRDQDNSNPTSLNYFNTLNPGASKSFSDVVRTAFGQSNMAAAFLVCSDQELLVASRTYNTGGAGTYGQGVPGFPLSQALTPFHLGYLTDLYENAGFRTNVGFVNTSLAPATVNVDFYLSDGTHLGTQSYALSPGEYIQRTRIFRDITGADIANGSIKITVSCGAVFAYASLIDNATGDPTYLQPVIQSPII